MFVIIEVHTLKVLNNYTFCFCKSNYSFYLECPPGYYGNDCRYQCSLNCYVTSACEKFTGQCIGGCKPGWTGIKCNHGKCLTILSDA